MKKLILLIALIAIAIGCKKEKATEPETTPPTAQQTWNGLYCISFIKKTVISATYTSYDTIGKMCGDNDDMVYYNYNNPYPAQFPGTNSHTGKQIYNCNQCH